MWRLAEKVVCSCSAAAADKLLLQICEMWESVGVADGIQSLDEHKNNTG